jgi:predicted secreted hydrolase
MRSRWERPTPGLRTWLAGLSVLGLAILALAWWLRPASLPAGGAAIDWAPIPTPAFARALAPRPFVYPLDLGPHDTFQTEWWYYTGNLDSQDGRHFGYQLTFFRRGLSPDPQNRAASLATQEFYSAHLAITDVADGRHLAWERFSRGALGLAGAIGDPYRVWLEDWQVQSPEREGRFLELQAEAEGAGLHLNLDSTLPYVPNGDRGLSAKGLEPGNASYYLSGTHLVTSGELNLGGESVAVHGLSWFDHEWSTSALDPQAIGWDWFSVQLSDGRQLMLFQIRNQDGSLSPVSSGTLVEAGGTVIHLTKDQMSIRVEGTWHSPASGADYPSRWTLMIPDYGIELHAVPWLADQEMRLSLTYWEGAVQVTGVSQGQSVSGNGYVELTGYAQSLQGAF